MKKLWGTSGLALLGIFVFSGCQETGSSFKSVSSAGGALSAPRPSPSGFPTPYSPTPPPPSPSPTSTPLPPGLTQGPLRVQGRQFVDKTGTPVYLTGAIICCELAKENGWPFISIEALEKIANHKANFTHVRLGPNTPDSEGPEFVAYLNVGNNKVDLYQWNPDFWIRLRQILQRARELGIYVEISLIDAWVLERPDIHAWAAQNNINGIDEGNCDMMRAHPRGIHEAWIRKIAQETGEFDNVMYEIGNETFDCGGTVTPEWELGIARIMRDELQKRGFGLRPIGTNSHESSIEDHFEIDYINRHVQKVLSGGSKPMLVNEYNGDFIANLTADQFLSHLREAYSKGTVFHLWRGDLGENKWNKFLIKLRDFHSEIGH
ncbi:MAG: hypothetical protein IT289_02730 [Oligoflexia bacterium]|nr:hypothetical protein [Oligoflexia bacterium]